MADLTKNAISATVREDNFYWDDWETLLMVPLGTLLAVTFKKYSLQPALFLTWQKSFAIVVKLMK